MKPLRPQKEYLESLPKKRSGVGVLFFDELKNVLIVKANYKKDGWQVPGGVIDADESPRQALIREIKEEINLDIKEEDLKFTVMEYGKAYGDTNEGYEFFFSGGVLSKEQIQKINIREDELDEYKFVPLNEALSLMRPSIRRRSEMTLKVLGTGIPMYYEYDKSVDLIN